MNRGLKKLWSVITTLIVASAIVLALLLAGGRLIGLKTFVVLSGSMEPAYHTGSLIYVRETDPYELETGDVITFLLSDGVVVTHRIADIVPDENDPSVIRFRTKGDANDSEDGGLVHYKNVIGEPVFTIPKLGYAAEYIQHPPGLYVTIAVGALLMLLTVLPEIVTAIKGENKEKGVDAASEKSRREKTERIIKTENPERGKNAAPEREGKHRALRKAARNKGRHEM